MTSELVKEQMEILKNQQKSLIDKCDRDIAYLKDSIRQLRGKIDQMIADKTKAENTLAELERTFPSEVI